MTHLDARGRTPRATKPTASAASRATLTDEGRFLDTVLDIAGSLICVFDAEGRFLRFNRACELVTGYSFDEIRGRPFYDFLVPKDEVDAVRAAIAQLRPGQPPAMRPRGGR